jgi:hypothetical protein
VPRPDLGVRLETLVLEQVPRSPRRNELPVKLIDRALLMGHQHLTGTLIELPQGGKTASAPDGVLHHPPETFDRVEIVLTILDNYGIDGTLNSETVVDNFSSAAAEHCTLLLQNYGTPFRGASP